MVIALVALIAVGPEQLPSLMRKMGNYAAQVRGMADGVRSEFMNGMEELDPDKWVGGDGSDQAPIVPRGFAESAQTTLGTPVVKPKTTPVPDSDESAEPEESAPEEEIAEQIGEQIGGEQEPVAQETAEQVEVEQKLAEQVAVDQATIDAIEHDAAADTPSEQESPSS